MAELLRRIPSADSSPELEEKAPARVAVLIEAMTEEEVALLAEDLVDVLARRVRGHRREVPSQPP